MATLYYSDSAVGAGTAGDIGDLLNWWQDAGFTIPNLAVPGAGDDAVIGAFTLTAGSSAADSNTLTGTTVNGIGTFNNNVSATSVTWTSGGCGGVITANAVNFNGSDPLAAGGIVSTNGCDFATNMAESVTDIGGNWTGGGSPFTFSGNVSIDSAIAGPISAIFTGTVSISNSPVGGSSSFSCPSTFTNCTVTAGSSATTVPNNFVDCTISGGTWGANVDLSGSVNVTGGAFTSSCTLAQTAAVTSIHISGATFTQFLIFTISFTDKIKVLTGNYNNTVNSSLGQAGTMIIPAANQVEAGIGFGPNGLTIGTLTGGTVTVGYFG